VTCSVDTITMVSTAAPPTRSVVRPVMLPEKSAWRPPSQVALPLKLRPVVGGHGGSGTGEPNAQLMRAPPWLSTTLVRNGPLLEKFI
jgi:hypothetical protein